MTELEHYFARELIQGSAFYAPNTMPARTERRHDVSSRSAS
jgi:hypothetical protein